MITDATVEQVHAICDEVIPLLDQNCILITTQEIDVDYYAGS